MALAVGDLVATGSPSFVELTRRLSAASVNRRWEAYRDIVWDAEENTIEPWDPRWELRAPWDPLGISDWYRDQPADRRYELGLLRQAMLMKASIEFESVLMEGLLRLATRLPNGDPMFRYLYHEISEEAQHSMMFQEFINRSGVDPVSSDEASPLFEKITALAETNPALFFIAALAGEEGFDHVQRSQLATVDACHPVTARITRIHVTEEARHVSFARGFLRDVVPRLPERELRALRYQTPYMIDWIANHLFKSGRVLVPLDEVPDEIAQDLLAGPVAAALCRDSMAKLVNVCDELGLVDARVASVWARVRHDDPAKELVT